MSTGHVAGAMLSRMGVIVLVCNQQLERSFEGCESGRRSCAGVVVVTVVFA